ncbi:E3 ubiquitin-protein ligase rma1h1 [Phtheirospermum japonicum]|uniref:E3 ubiquitin-protein ligase RMA n=1 Tax=Phtheirospermum japonicum TaxID=374723 RepID=A0A830DQ54_9LAMI|nr:E3 ubiquitin-protein ligase rma1h1 [Phtheirospermum japonicum]
MAFQQNSGAPTIQKLINSSSSQSATVQENLNGCFDCNICLDSCNEPVVTLCGHLYCWPCIYKWLHIQNTSFDSDERPKCPVCKAFISTSSLVPLYGRGRSPPEPEPKKPQLDLTNIPPRPPALGTSTLLPDQQNNRNPLENEAFHQQLRSYTLGGPSTTSSFSPTINMVGEIVYSNSYPFPGNGSPRLRRQEVQLDKSLNRVSIFLFCCIALCLILF